MAVFITNQITSEFNNELMLALDGLPKPVGGNVIAHASTTRLALRKGPGNKRLAKIFDSPDLEEKEVGYVITAGGIADPEK